MVRISRQRMNMEDGRIDRPVLKDYSEIAVGSTSTVFTGVDGTYTIDVESGNTYSLILNANCSFTFSNPTGSGNLCSFTLILKQDWLGRRTVTWPAAVRWQSAVTPTLAVSAGDYDIFSFSTFDGGTTWFGFMAERDHLNGVSKLWESGDNSQGQIGNGNILDRSSPTQVGTLTDWQSLAGGTLHSVGVRSDGTLWTWGDNAQGQLGHNNAVTVDRSSPTQVGALTNWAQVSSSGTFTLALKTDGTAWAWGFGTLGRLGNLQAITRSSPVQVGAASDWRQVAAGTAVGLGLKTNGSLWAWGAGADGNAGFNDAINRSSPAQVGALTDWAQIAAGGAHVAAIKTDGTLWTWGRNIWGHLGNSSILSRSSPIQIGSLTDWAQVTAGAFNTLALKTDGTLWGWGYGVDGTNGQNDGINRSSPQQIGSLTNWAHVALTPGSTSAFAIKTDGTLWSWGWNTTSASGILGLNTGVSRSSPTQIGSFTNWMNVSAGTYHAFFRQFP